MARLEEGHYGIACINVVIIIKSNSLTIDIHIIIIGSNIKLKLLQNLILGKY